MKSRKRDDKGNSDLTQLQLKMKYVFLPCLSSIVYAILLYNIIRWIIDVYLSVWPLQDTIWNLTIPITMSSCIVFFYMRPRIKLLRFKLFAEDSPNIFCLLLFLLLFPSLAMSHGCVNKASYNVIDIEKISNIQQYPKQKFFRLINENVNKEETVSSISTRLIGKYNNKFRVNLYLVAPFSNANNIWLGESFRMVIDNDISKEKKIQKVNEFLHVSTKLYLEKNMPTTGYLEKLINSDTKYGYLSAIESSGNTNISDSTIVIAKVGTLKEEIKKELDRFAMTFFIGISTFFLMVLRANLDKKAFIKFRAG